MPVKRLALLTCAIPLLAGSQAPSAKDYRFVFAPFEARFDPRLAQNRATLAAASQLMRDLAGAGSVRFVLVGERQADCAAADTRCDSEGLVRQRVEAVAAELLAQSSNPQLVDHLQWQGMAPVGGAGHVEGLSLRLRILAADPRPDLCPYQVQISDPRLPPLVAPDNSDATEWVPVTGLGAISVSAQGSVRVVAGAAPAGASFLTAIEMLPAGAVRLQSGVAQAQWRVTQMTWNAGAADVRISFGAQRGTLAASNTDTPTRSRGVGDVVQDWPSPPAEAASPARACDLHFVLSPPAAP